MKHFISINSCKTEDLRELLDISTELKKVYLGGAVQQDLKNRTLVMMFEKPSLRTRISFQTAMTDLGGNGIYVKPEDIGGIGQREPIKDCARVLSRYCHGIVARTFKHETITDLADFSNVPVINALSDWSHPCQAMADLLTIEEHFGQLKGKKIAYVGDGNNVARSLAFACAKFDMKITIASPAGYELDEKSINEVNRQNSDTLVQTHDSVEAVKDADVVYTDTWVSMGQEAEKQQRIKIFAPYQVNAELMSKAPAQAKVMHCLPAYRDLEITDEVVESAQSVIFDQAENRLHFQRALLKKLLGSKK